MAAAFLTVSGLASPSAGLAAETRQPPGLVFACRADNDLYRAVCRARGARPPRRGDVAAAVRAAPRGAGVLALADGYPGALTAITRADYEAAAGKGVRLFVEFPAELPDGPSPEPRKTQWERAVVATDTFGPDLERLRILAIHDCTFVPVTAPSAHLVVARVAGYDTAVFGLPPTTWPVLYEARERRVLVSSTCLSRFVRARYAPAAAWRSVWRWVLDWLEPNADGHNLAWEPSVGPSYGRADALPVGAETAALRRAASWFARSRMLVHPDWARTYDVTAALWPDRVGPAPNLTWPAGDGSLGVLEGFSSSIGHDGRQPARWWRRNDCNGEAAGALALAGAALGSKAHRQTAGRIGDWLYTRSVLANGKRADPADPAYGLIGWNDVTRYWGDMDGYGVYYADDEARSMLGMMAAGATLRTDRWSARLARCIVANLRVTGRKGYQPDRIDTGPLEANGWRAYRESDVVSHSPHYQGYLWACFLWAGRQARFTPLTESAVRGIAHTMAAYPGGWNSAVNSLALERARMLLPLAWLVRVDDKPEHRAWLRRVAGDLLARQDASGAIREELAARGEPSPPRSNEAYGTTETPLQQTDRDPAVDLLYTANFALLGLHEAATATGDPYYREAEDRLVEFMCRAQVRSRAHPEFDGGWFRAFDAERWEYWASNADTGWGAWAMESGWSNTWMTSVLALRRMGSSLWDVAGRLPIRHHIDREVAAMLP